MKKRDYIHPRLIMLGFVFGFITTLLLVVLIRSTGLEKEGMGAAILLVLELPVFGFLSGLEIKRAVFCRKAWIKGYRKGRMDLALLAEDLARRIEDTIKDT